MRVSCMVSSTHLADACAEQLIGRNTPLDAAISRWRTGDEAAAQQLYEAAYGRTFRLCIGLLENVEDAEEVTQDALTYALLNIGRFDPTRAQFTTWLHTITVSRCRDKRRRKRFSLISLMEWGGAALNAPCQAPLPEQSVAQQLDQQVLWQTVHTLPPLLREAIVLRYWAQHSFKEMADILDCPIGTAQSRVRLGYQRIRRQLEIPTR